MADFTPKPAVSFYEADLRAAESLGTQVTDRFQQHFSSHSGRKSTRTQSETALSNAK